ncbi:hypothetical protein HMPREF9071_1639 [Capnocytophaga sp. oral taxon 338 str. F0234]|nr:hypothetical protein HMPREF9071_1639 [Capnocytophaga sp. oral taxon 338 str. F0234]
MELHQLIEHKKGFLMAIDEPTLNFCFFRKKMRTFAPLNMVDFLTTSL